MVEQGTNNRYHAQKFSLHVSDATCILSHGLLVWTHMRMVMSGQWLHNFAGEAAVSPAKL